MSLPQNHFCPLEASIKGWYGHVMEYDLPSLPIHDVLPQLKADLTTHQVAVLAAEPGSGKTTIVPLALLNEPWLAGRKIIMLEPRRLAARMAAKRLSDLANDKVGGLVGYQIRFDNKISPKTRIEVVTEGILSRRLQNDPELAGAGLIIFDEFHERSIHADLALAFCLDVQELRDDLKILIMSATIDTDRISQLLKGAPVIKGHGRSFPVEIHYLPRPPVGFLVDRTISMIHKVIAEHSGDILVFLPGAGEIRNVQKRINSNLLCLPLYGNLPQNQQDLIFAPTKKRRLLLATPIAETSLTLEGVSVVIDSGFVKTPYFSPATALTTLEMVSISKASAKQRAGRAGRLGPGICYRLWTKGEHYSKTDFSPPEIVNADLAPLLLEILQWGVSDPAQLRWLDPPRAGQINQAKELLVQIGALDARGALTDIGLEISGLPLHPRLAIMLVRGSKRNGPLACRLAALLQNRDIFRDRGSMVGADIEDRLECLHLFEKEGPASAQVRGADPSLCRRVLQEARLYQRLIGAKNEVTNFHDSGSLLALAYPNRIAQKKQDGSQHVLASGRGVALPKGDHLHRADFLVVAHVDGGNKQGRIFLAAALSREEIIERHQTLLTREERITWVTNHVEANTVLSLGCLELSKKPVVAVDASRVTQCLLEGIKQLGIDCLGWQKKSRALQARLQFVHECDPEQWPDVSDTHLLDDLSWLEPFLSSVTSLKKLQKIDLCPVLLSSLSWREQQELDRLAPSHFQVPSGSKIKLAYHAVGSPTLAVRLQEMFGAHTTPTVFGGKVPVLVHLLSPAGRPIQVTKDLAGFWKKTYTEVKKELKGRYPKHFWPDDPLVAKATHRATPRKQVSK